ncbi:sporulation histidine kinase inhibitor Sda [Shouchella patagoniensis]
MTIYEIPTKLMQEAFVEAKKLKLQEDFTDIFKNELIRRSVDFTSDGS